jgi:hypothetical protein
MKSEDTEEEGTMKTITRNILMVMVAILFAWGLVPAEVRAMAHPCEQLAAQNNEAEELKDEIEGLAGEDGEIDSAESEAWDAWMEYSNQCTEAGVYWHTPDSLLAMAEDYRDAGNHEMADLYESAAETVRPAWDIYQALLGEAEQLRETLRGKEQRLSDIRDSRHSLMVECGLVTEMSDPMSSFDRRVTRPVDPRPVPGDGHSAQAAEASGTDQMESNPSFTAEIMQVEQSESISSGKKLFGYTTMPVPHASAIKTTSKTLEAARLFNNLPAGTNQGGNQSTPTVTAQTMQVQQPANTSTSSNTFVYTHMRIPQNAGQSGARVTPRVTLKAVPFVKPMRVNLGSSVKR